ncbi:MAG: ABC transporter permease [Candidatus Aminicenantes bacterium]|nr:ABC transporter permease [Candidatus Aminicenantes bacterium]
MGYSRKYTSPGLARRLLQHMTAYHHHHSIVEDFEETFQESKKSKSVFKAKCWYWSHVLKSWLKYLRLIWVGRIIMLKNYFKIAFRNIKRHRLYSFINICGLALGLTVCIIIGLWVQRECSYDLFHQNARRIYRVEREIFRDNLYSRWPIGSGQYKKFLLEDFAEIENAARFWRREFAIKDTRNVVRSQEMFAVDHSVFRIFDFGLEQGDEKTALKEPHTLVMTRKNALKYFGTDDVIGRSLSLEFEGEQVNFKVTGILKEVPENSHILFDTLISISSYSEDTFSDLRSNYLYTYVLAREGVSRRVLEEKMKMFVGQRLKPVYGDLLVSGLSIHEVLKVRMYPIIDIHLHPAENWELEPGGSINLVYIFSTIAVFILFLACINFINLSTARANKRAKEVCLRKTVGAGKSQLRAQFIQESALSSLLSLICSLVFCALLIPVFNQSFDVHLSLKLLSQPKNLFAILGITLTAGILSGLYPAVYLTRFDPVTVLKGSISRKKGSTGFRKNLVVFQFVISTIILFGMFTVYRQMRYIQTRSLGFDRENVVVIPAGSRQASSGFEPFRNELLQNTNIVSLSNSTDLPGDPLYGNGGFRRTGSKETVSLIIFSADHDYVETLKMDILAGRNFSREHGTDRERTILLNEAAVKRIGWTLQEAVGNRLIRGENNPPLEVIGVVKNFHFKSLRTEVEPMVIQLLTNVRGFISIKIKPDDIKNTIALIRQKWEKFFPGERFDFSFLDSRIQKLYDKEKKMQKLFLVFSALSLFVACLGLFGLASYTAEVKTKEIGIRKTLGASAGNVTFFLSKEFIKWILIANVFGCPIAFTLMNKWLQNFAYRIDIGWTVFIFTVSVTLLTALFSFAFQAMKAAWANPVDSLRYE